MGRQERDVYFDRIEIQYNQLEEFRQTVLDAQSPISLPPAFCHDESFIVRQKIADILRQSFSKIANAPELISQLLEDKDWRVRERATGALRWRSKQKKIPEVGVLLRPRFKDVHHKVRSMAVRALEANFDQFPDAIDLFSSLAQDEHPEVRIEVLDVSASHLSELDDSLAWMENFAKDLSEDVLFAAGGIMCGSLSNTIGPEKVIKAFSDSEAWQIRSTLMILLIWRFNDIPGAENYIANGLRDPDDRVRNKALYALAKKYFRIPKAASYLLEALEDDSPEVRFKARSLYEAALFEIESRKHRRDISLYEKR